MSTTPEGAIKDLIESPPYVISEVGGGSVLYAVGQQVLTGDSRQIARVVEVPMSWLESLAVDLGAERLGFGMFKFDSADSALLFVDIAESEGANRSRFLVYADGKIKID